MRDEDGGVEAAPTRMGTGDVEDKSKGHIKRGTGHTPWKENASCNEQSKWNGAVTKVCRAMSQHEGKEQQSKQWSGDAVVRRR